MKKITDFIIDKRYLILVVMIILSFVSLFVSKQVKINYDMTNYLPKDSNTKIGMNIMKKEFDDEVTSSLNIKVNDLTKAEREREYNYLLSLDNVSTVTYEEVDDATVYYITMEKASDSKEAKKLYNKVHDHFKESLELSSGDIADHNESVLPFYVIVIAVLSALIILIIMCESYIEPFLFLISILMAVALNAETNIIFNSVSNITNSISAVLQMALSMDYSIMLMNRYRQERVKEKDKNKAMKKALYHAFKAISSSSITTIVGLLALVFMSFTIGRDLGFVLAKGVLFSLISIFTCLPCLILMCDNLIFKTKKKSINIRMQLISKFSYWFRKASVIVFIIVFLASFFLKGNLGILFTSTGSKKVDEVFASNNQMVIIYPNNVEQKAHNLCHELDQNKSINQALCYGNTINDELTYTNLKNKLDEFDVKIDIDDELFKILYYYYYNQKDDSKIELNTLINFVATKDNQMLNSSMKNSLDELKNFTDKSSIKKQRTKDDLAHTLNIDQSTVKDLQVYYNSKNVKTKMTLNTFVSYMQNSILTNSKYNKMIDNNTKNSLTKINKFLNKKTLNKKMTAKEMSNLFAIDQKMVEQLYTYYLSNSNINSKLTIYEFVSFINNNVLTNNDYASLFDEEKIKTIKLLMAYNTKMDLKTLASLFNMNVDMLYLIFNGNEVSLKPYEFINVLLSNNMILANMDEKQINSLKMLNIIMTKMLDNEAYTYQEMSNYLNLDKDTVKNIYVLRFQNSVKLTPEQFVAFILKHQNDDVLKNKLSKDMLKQLTFLQKIIKSVQNNTKYSSKELSQFLGVNNDLSLIYSLYEIDKQKKNVNLSYEQFINFLIKDVMQNKNYKHLINNEMQQKILSINTIMQDSLKKVKYDSNEAYQKLSSLEGTIDKNLIKLLYIYYGSSNSYHKDWTLTIEKFVNFLNNKVINNDMFSNYVDDDMKEKVREGTKTVQTAKDKMIGENYSRIILNTSYEPETKETFNFIKSVKDELPNSYIIGDSPMAYDMSQTFSSELNLITVLTMIFIFVVVVITFKSILIPIVLVLLIQCAVFVTMGILSFGGSVYFMSILIVQSILMGATIDYAILYTSYYLEARNKHNIKDSILKAYNNSIHTILNSALILMIVTLIVGSFSNDVSAKICTTISQGTLCSAILIIGLLPSVLAAIDKFVIKKKV